MLVRRTIAVGALALVALCGFCPAAAAQDGEQERKELPGTQLQAEQRDDGQTNAAPWVIGSGIAAIAVIGIGGTYVQRRTTRASGGAG